MRGGFKRNRSHDQRVGARLPQKMQDEIAEQGEKDDRRFDKPAYLKGPSRKELRKQKRLEKRKRNAAYHSGRPIEPAAKRQKTQGKVEKKQPKETTTTTNKKQEKQKTKKKESKKDNDAALERMSKSNPNVYSLLQSDNLVSANASTSKRDFDEDDREIAYWEKKLGINKKKKTNINKALAEDGLLDLLEGLGGAEPSQDDAEMSASEEEEEDKEEENEDIMDESEEEEDDDDDALEKELAAESSDEEDDVMDEDQATSAEEEELISEDEMDAEDAVEQSEQDQSSGEEQDSDNKVKNGDDKQSSETKKPETPSAGRYVPPHLRKAATTQSEQQIKLQRTLQGLLNRLSESNIENILFEIEKCYTNYTRHDVTSTVTNLVLTSIAQKSNLLDSFVITYAAVIGGLYRLVGIDFVAHFVQTLVETFESNYQKCEAAIQNGDIQEADDETTPGAREAKNLLTLALELYNFQVIACILVYDLVRFLIANLDEYSVELLLKIVKTAGGQLRSDDPGSLKAIIEEVQKETAKRDAKSISTRHKFMLETLANIKNNKIKTGPTASGQADKELVLKLKKFLNSLGKKRTVRSSEALRVSLEDIHQIETKGKWWLVGASWKDNMVGTESKHATQAKVVAEDLRKDQSMQQALLKLARKQGMNTDIRRSIFVTIMSAEDYLDAFEKVMKLGLTEVQQREIARVLLQCTGNEKTFNPYYMLLSRKLCQTSHSFKVTYQYCLWDFLRECGETDVGGLERTLQESESTNNGSKVRLSRIVNVAKLYAAMIASGALSLSVLRSLNFMTLGKNGRLWLELLFIHIFAQAKQEGPQTIVNVFSKILEMRTLAQGCLFFLQESVVGGVNSGYGGVDPETVRWGCKLAKEVLRK